MGKELTWFTIGSIVNINDFAGLNKLKATKDELISFFFVTDEGYNYYEVVEVI